MTCLLIAHVTFTAAIGIDWIISLIGVAVAGVIAKTVMKLASAFNLYLFGLCTAILLAHIVIALAGLMLG